MPNEYFGKLVYFVVMKMCMIPHLFFILQLWDVRKLLYFFGAANIIELEESLHEQDNWTASSKGFLPQQP